MVVLFMNNELFMDRLTVKHSDYNKFEFKEKGE